LGLKLRLLPNTRRRNNCLEGPRGRRYVFRPSPDHVPHIDAANSDETAFAFCFGYIIGLFQADGWDPYGAGIGGGPR
jgi:hypothetical protein